MHSLQSFSLSLFLHLILFFIMINDQRFNDNSDGVLNKKKKRKKKEKNDEAVLPALLQMQCVLEGFYPFLSKMLQRFSCLKHLSVNQSQPAGSI